MMRACGRENLLTTLAAVRSRDSILRYLHRFLESLSSCFVSSPVLYHEPNDHKSLNSRTINGVQILSPVRYPRTCGALGLVCLVSFTIYRI
jgi:hypothetical protein